MRGRLMLAAGLAALAQPVWAEEATNDEASLQELVVVGSRGAPRLATETAAPVDVLSGRRSATGASTT